MNKPKDCTLLVSFCCWQSKVRLKTVYNSGIPIRMVTVSALRRVPDKLVIVRGLHFELSLVLVGMLLTLQGPATTI